MFNRAAYENTRPDGIAVLEIVDGAPPQEERPRQFVPLKRTELRGEVVGPLAALRLTQVYGYTREQCDKVLEALYRFPLPGDAAVTGVLVRFGAVEISAELKEREKAEADYAEAKRRGQQAALATRESPDVFTLQVAGIQPDQDVTVETSYVQLARAEGAGWSLRLPLTTAPRYVRSDELTSRHAHGQPLLLLRDPGHRFSLDLTLRGAGTAQSSTHPLDVTPQDGDLHLRLQGGEVLPDRDCVFSWQPQQEADRPALQVLLHDDPASGQVYFLALVAPPATHTPGHGVPREVVLLVDHSGSMEGAKWQAADWAVKRFLSDLTPSDAFALELFHNITHWFAAEPRPADSREIAKAVRFLEQNRDSGGTELGVALEQALSLKRLDGAYARHALIVTDAQVTDAGRIMRLASEEARRAKRRRISVLCIDAATNSFLALQLAERGGGMARFLTSAPEEEDITTALDEVLADWAEPVLAGLRLEVNRPLVQAAGHEVSPGAQTGWSAIDLGDLPAGRPVWVAGRLPRGDTPDLLLRLTASGQPEVATQRLDLAQEASQHPALKALFGARRVLGLEFLISSGYAGEQLADQLARLGYDPQQVLAGRPGAPPKVYAENVRAEAQVTLHDLLVGEALDYGLACSETAFVAVRREAGKPVEGTVLVANALPSGWSEEFLGPHAMLVAAAPSVAGGPRAQAARAKMAPARPAYTRMFGLADSGARSQLESKLLFSGVPQFTNDEALLFDSGRAQDAPKLADSVQIAQLKVHFPGGVPKPQAMDPRMSLLIFVDDLSSPRASVRLVDLVRQGGERPLNLLRQAGQVVRLVLVSAGGAWPYGVLQVEVALQALGR